MKAKILSLLLIVMLLMPTSGITATSMPVASPDPVMQEVESQQYLLQLGMPEVNIPSNTPPADVPGHYHAALYRQWTEVEGVLKAMQERGWVEDYTLLPEANAFRITAYAEAAAQLEPLGNLSTPPLMAMATETGNAAFRHHLEAAVQGAQRQLESEAQARSPEQSAAPPPDMPPAGVDYLVRLTVSGEDKADSEAQYALTAYLEWLKETHEVQDYRWLPEARAFQVRGAGDLSALRQQPEVASLAPYSEQAVQLAIEETRATRGAPMPLTTAELQALAITTPTLNVELYSNQLYARSYTATTTVFTLTTSSGTLKNDPANTTTSGWYWSGSYYYAYVYLYNNVGYDVPLEPGDVLEVAQEGETPFSMEIPELTALVDRNTNTVSGRAPANISSVNPANPPALSIEARGINRDGCWWGTVSKHIPTDAAGRYSTVFTYTNPTTGTLDLRPPNTYGYLNYVNVQGNRVRLSYRAPEVQVGVYNSRIEGYAGMPRAGVTGTLTSGTGVVKGQFVTQAYTYSGGWFSGYFYDSYNNLARSMPGDTVEIATSYGTVITVPVVELTALADPIANTVTGVGPANIAVTATNYITLPGLKVDVYGPSPSPEQWVTTDSSGNYTANKVGDFSPGTDGYISYYTGDGDSVRRYFRAPIVYARGYSYRYANENFVSGYAAQGNILVTLNLKRGGTVIATAYRMTDDYGYYYVYLYDLYGNPVNIQGGDVVEVSAEGVTTTVEVPTFDVVSDYVNDRVTGVTDAEVITTTYGLTQTLAVWPTSSYDWDYGKHVAVTTTGAFTATNPFYDEANPDWGSATLDWGAEQAGHLRYVDANANRIYARFQAPPAEVEKPLVYVRGYYGNNAYQAENYVSGYVPNYCGYGAITLRDGHGALKAQNTNVWACHSFGVYLSDIYGSPIDIQAGDTVEAAFGEITTVVEVPTFDVASDYVNDRVTGVTDAEVITTTYGLTQTLAVWPTSSYDWDYGKHVAVTTTGAFTATNPFYDEANPDWGSATLDWGAEQAGHLRYVDANANRIYARFQAPPAEVEKPLVYVRGYYGNNAYQAENYVSGYVPNYCGYGAITLRDGHGALKAQNTNVWACHSFGVYFYNASSAPANIRPGDTVEITFGEATTVVEVPSFDVASDPVNDRVTGVTDAEVVTTTYGLTQTLAVWPTSSYDWGYGKHVAVTTTGAFTATNPFYYQANPDGGSTTLDWGEGQIGHLRYVDANANRIYARFVAPRETAEIRVHKDGNDVSGYVVASVETLVTVTLKSGNTVKATAYATASSDGYFSIQFYDLAGNPVLIEEGDDVTVETADRSTITVPVVPLTGQANVTADIVSGMGPGNELLGVSVGGGSGRQSVATDAAGVYQADFRGIYDIRPGNQIEVSHRNEDGHTVYIRFYAGPKLYAQLHSYYAWGYSVAANAPLTLTLSSGATVKERSLTQSDSSNYFSAYFYDATGQRAIIEGGDTLAADFGNGRVVTMTATAMTANVNADADTLAGTGPANTLLGVSVGNFNATIMTDAAGKWQADASGVQDITRGQQAQVRHVNQNSHETWLYAVAPVIYLRGSGSGATAYQAENYLSGYATQRAIVNITLKRGATTLATRQLVANSWDGYYSTYLYNALGLPAAIQGGDRVIVSASPEETIDVPLIEVEIDADADTVTGVTSLVNQALGLYVNGNLQTVHTDSSGNFTATFGSINPGDYVYIRHQNGAGHWIHARFRATTTGNAVIYARWNGSNVCENCVSGYASKGNTVASVALRREGSTIATATALTSYSRWFSVAFTDEAGDNVPIASGDVIEVTASDPVSMTVTALTAQANTDSRVLYGSGPANASLYWQYGYGGGSSYGGTGTIGPDGHYSFNLGFSTGATGYVRHTSGAGHHTYLTWAAPYAWVREHGNSVGGYVRLGVPVTVRLLGSSGAERAVATTTSSTSNGYFWVSFLDAAGNPLIIHPHDTVRIEASQPVTIPVVPLTAEADPSHDRVTGTGPANAQLDVWTDNCWREVTTGAAGAFTANFSGECDLEAGDWVEIAHSSPEGNQVYISFSAPMVQVNTVNNIVDGYATPNASARLTLKRGGSTLATATTSTKMDGWFSAFFTDANGKLLDIKAGDTVEVTSSPTMSVPAVNLSATLDINTDAVSGRGPANALLLVRIYSQGGGSSRDKSVLTDSAGNFNVDLSGEMDLTSSSYAYVRYSDANGHRTSIHTTPARSPRQIEAEQSVQGQGAQVVRATFGAANGNDLTPPLTYFGGGSGTTVFASAGGTLVLTYPDGTVHDSGATRIVMKNTPLGQWQIQVRLWSGEGSQYAIAVGRAAHTVYLPLVVRNVGGQ
ncbi:MAG TPA: hypothetical protein PKV82_06210 [Anaerolineae bacterium]|nr:hypothetical protein [Anaerolineae bacterium]